MKLGKFLRPKDVDFSTMRPSKIPEIQPTQKRAPKSKKKFDDLSDAAGKLRPSSNQR